MTLPNDITRCTGDRCQSRMQCLRHIASRQPAADNKPTLYAAFWARREAGASACESFIPLVELSGGGQ